jgi:hypothetical protein
VKAEQEHLCPKGSEQMAGKYRTSIEGQTRGIYQYCSTRQYWYKIQQNKKNQTYEREMSQECENYHDHKSAHPASELRKN